MQVGYELQEVVLLNTVTLYHQGIIFQDIKCITLPRL